MSYLAFVLDEKSRTNIFHRIYPPEHCDVIAHHVTMVSGVKKGLEQIALDLCPTIHSAMVVGYVADDKGEAYVVSINGVTHRMDEGVYHITISIDRSQGVKPVYSNQLIKEKGWTEVDPFEITGSVQVLD